MKASNPIQYGFLIIAIIISLTWVSFAGEDDGASGAMQHTVIGALTAEAQKKPSESKEELQPDRVNKTIGVLEDKTKLAELLAVLKTIRKGQEKVENKSDQSVIASTRSLLGRFAERSLLGVQSAAVSFWKLLKQGIDHFKQCTPQDIMFTFALFVASLLIALLIETFVRRFSFDTRASNVEVKTLTEQIKFVFAQTIHFIVFCIPLYLVNALGVGVGEHIKPFGLELASLAILIRASIKIRGMHLIVKNREISDILVIILVFLMVIFFVALYVIQHNYLIHVGIYFFVLLGFFLALRLSLWRTHRKELDHWLFFKISKTSYGTEIYSFNDKLLKVFSGYFLILMAIVFLQIISGQYTGDINEYQLFSTCFLLLLTTLVILLAVYAKFGFLRLLEQYAKREMVKFYQQTVLSATDIFTFIVMVLLAKNITELWFPNFINLFFRPEYQDFFRSVSKIIFYTILSRFLWRLIDFLAIVNMAKKKEGKKTIVPSQLRLTVTPILKSVGHWLLLIFTFALVLEEIGIPIWPLIYSISVLGIAISLGAQSLVKDFINGILTLVEGNIAIGEVVTIGAFTGTVETLSLRGVALRHSSGALQTIPFSEVTNIINKSRDYSSASIEVPVPFETNVQDVYMALHRAFEDIQGHEIYGHRVLDKISISGIDRLAEGAYFVTASIRIKPDPSNRFLKTFNEYLKKRLDEMGIKPPLIQSA